jgi:hypothetical protein
MNFLIRLALCFFFSGCIFSTNQQYNDYYKQLILNYWKQNPNIIENQLSMDGRRFSTSGAGYTDYEELQIVEIEKINDARVITSFDKPPGKYFGFEKWSPDNKAFIVRSSDNISRCGDNRFLGYVVDGKSITLSSIFENEFESCSNFVWSPNGREILIYKNSPDIFKWDVYSNKTTKFDLELGTNEELWGLYWDNNGIYYNIQKEIQYRVLIYEFYKISLEDPSKRELIVRSSTENKFLFSTDKSVIFYNNFSGYPEKADIFEWNIKSGKSHLVETFEGRIVDTSISTKNSTIALDVTYDKNDEHLYLYNIENRSFEDKGQIFSLIGWKNVVNGFVIIKIENNEYKVDLISI